MFDFLAQIGAVISTIINFFVMSFESLIFLFTHIFEYLSLLLSSINVLPSFLIPFGVAFITLSVVQYILNRKSSS